MTAIPMKKPNAGQLKNLPLDLLDAHPKNPRRIKRDDVIEQISEQLRITGELDPSHALIVRPVNGRYQIISGHNRRWAAQEAGLKEVPAWVRDLSDEEAFLQLVLNNTQGELHPLERGAHALDAVERGKTLREYAASIGAKNEKTVYMQCNAAEVAILLKQNFADLKGYMKHLSYIHAADRKDWPHWVQRLLAGEFENVEDLRKALQRSKQAAAKLFYTIDDWQELTLTERTKLLETAGKSQFNAQSDASIEWAQWSWNPVTGCLHNCPYCYARDIANRFYEQKFVPTLIPNALKAASLTPIPNNARENIGYRNVFVCSMADLFGKWVPNDWITAVLREVAANPQWNFLFLTKFPQRMAEFDYPENAWLGTSVDLKARVKNAERAMSKVKATVRWLSLEPLIEPLEMDWSLFQWVVIGGASASSETPAWQPPRRWIWDITFAAQAAGCAVYHKDNLMQRMRDYPGAAQPEPQKADPRFHYLKVIA